MRAYDDRFVETSCSNNLTCQLGLPDLTEMFLFGVPSIELCGALLPILMLLIFLRVDRAFKIQPSPDIDGIKANHNDVITPFTDGSDGWTFIGAKGGIESYVKKVEGSPLLAFRGVAYLDMHISQAMGPYINLTTSYDWVSMLKHIQRIPITDARLHDGEAAEDLVYQVIQHNCHLVLHLRTIISHILSVITQVLELPWPVSPRDVLLHRNFHFDEEQRTVAVHYHSVDDSRVPLAPGVIRAESPHSMWRFRSLPAFAETNNVHSTHTAQSQTAPEKKVATNSSWLQRKMTHIKQRFSSKKRPVEIELSVKFARTQPSSIIPEQQTILPRQVIRPVEVPKRPALNALLALLKSQKKDNFDSQKVRPVKISGNIIYHHDTTEATTKDVGLDVHDKLAHLVCKSAPALRQQSVHKGQPDSTTAASKHTKHSKHRSPRHRGSGTVVEFESFVDSKGNIPAWFINYMQR